MEPVPPEIVSGGCQVGLVAPVVAFVVIQCSKPCVAGATDMWTFKRSASCAKPGSRDDTAWRQR